MMRMKMLNFRMFTMFLLLSLSEFILKVFNQPYGMMRLLESMTESEILEIIIMEILALSPPKKTIAEMN